MTVLYVKSSLKEILNTKSSKIYSLTQLEYDILQLPLNGKQKFFVIQYGFGVS